MARRKTLIIVSVAAHVALGAAFYAAGRWRLDRADRVHPGASVIATLYLPAPSGGSIEPPKQDLDPKRPKPDGLRQPEPKREAKPAESTPQGEVPGLGDNPDGKPTDVGTCTDPAVCAETAPPEPKPEPKPEPQPVVPKIEPPRRVAPPDLAALRIAGETQVHPSTATQQEMMRDAATTVTGSLEICIGADGAIETVRVSHSTRYAAYDQKLVEAARRWRYRPYTLAGTSVRVCSTITFRYQIR